MGFYPFEVTAPHLVYTLLGGYVYTLLSDCFHNIPSREMHVGQMLMPQVHRRLWHV
jgi:hypothetical protein